MDRNFSESRIDPGALNSGPSILESLWPRILYVVLSFAVLWNGAIGQAHLIKGRILIASILAMFLLFVSTRIYKRRPQKNYLAKMSHVNILKTCAVLLTALGLSGYLIRVFNRDVLTLSQGSAYGITLLKDLIKSLDLFSWSIILLVLVPILSFTSLSFLAPFFGAFNLSFLGALTVSLGIGNLWAAPLFFIGLYASSWIAKILNPFFAAVIHSAFYFLLLFAIRVFL